MAKGFTAVWFKDKEKKRYSDLGINTVFRIKIKQLFNDYLEQKEAEKTRILTEAGVNSR